MTITRRMLDSELKSWFHNKRNAEKAKGEILKLFSKEPEDYIWTQQDMVNDKSGMNRELHIRFRESLGVKLPWVTRLRGRLLSPLLN